MRTKSKRGSGKRLDIQDLYYFARKYKKCGVLVWGESEDSETEARKHYDRKTNVHRQPGAQAKNKTTITN